MVLSKSEEILARNVGHLFGIVVGVLTTSEA